MIFDRLCAIIERVYPSEPLKRLLKQARIFEFPGRLHEVARGRDWNEVGGAEFLHEHFFLPFPVVAMEDSASCVVIADDTPEQSGLNVRRTFIECMDLAAPIEEFGHSMADPAQRERALRLQDNPTPSGACVVSISQIHQCRLATASEIATRPGGTGLVFEGTCAITFVASKDVMIVNPETSRLAMRATDATTRATEAALINATAALEEIMFFNSPDRFIVERSPDVARKPGAKGLPEIRRSPERPHYILLRPVEIRARLGMDDAPVHDRRSPTPHARRRHFRTLRSDRFTNRAGQVVVVKASWVGPHEGTYKGRQYKVCLDL